MNIWQVVGVAVLTATAALLLDGERRRPVILCGAGLLLLQCVLPMQEFASFLRESIPSDLQETVKPVWKALGIGGVCAIGGSVLRECGAETTARALELYARMQILLLSLPLLRQLLEIARDLLC